MIPNSTNDSTQKSGQEFPPRCVELEKNELTRIRIARTSYRGHEFVDVRTLVKNDTGDFVPTKKGITVSPQMLPALISALHRLELEGGGE